MWQKIKEEVRYKSYKTIITKFFKMPNDLVGEFDIVSGKDWVTVIAFTPEMKLVVFEQFRPGVEKVVLNFPGGNLDQGMSPLEAAENELLEETGYKAGKIIQTAKTMVNPYDSRYCYSFIALDCVKVSEPDPEDEEHPVLREIPLDAFRAMIQEEPGIAELQTFYFALEYLGMIKP